MVNFKEDTDALWAAVTDQLKSAINSNINWPQGRPYCFKTSNNIKILSYVMVFGKRDKTLKVCVETNEGESGRNFISDIIAKAPNSHPIKRAELAQGEKNKEKWAWTISTNYENMSNDEIVAWYKNNYSDLYTFFENVNVPNSKTPISNNQTKKDQDNAYDIEKVVEGSSTEVANAKIRVYGKAQNRTALGIAHAYMVMYPQATMEDLIKAFPKSLNPDSGEKENFILASEIPASTDWKGYFNNEEELITTGDGKKVALVMLWTKPSFERIVFHAKQYGIIIADFEKRDGGAKKGGFRLEYLNGYVPPMMKEKKKSLWWVWLLLLLLFGGLAAFFALRKPQVVEVEKIVEVEKVVYLDRIEEIEKNFNAAQFIQGRADLSEDVKFVLHDLAKEMQRFPEVRLRIVGHTSSEGDPAFNQKLSEDRAQAAVDFPINHGGIDASRLEAIGKGSSEPIDLNNPEANRRTEFIIIE